MRFNYRLTFIFLFSCVNLFAQDSKEYNNYRLKYPDERIVQLVDESIVEISLKNNNISILEHTNEEKIYLNSIAKYQAKESLVFTDFFKIDKVAASSFNFIDGKYREFKVTDFKEKDELGSSAFYDDRKSINFYYQGLQSGSKTKLSYQTDIKNPRFIGSYFLGNFFPIENYYLKIIVNKNIHMEFKLMYCDTVNLDYKRSTKGSNIIHEWRLKDIKSYSTDDNAINFKYTIPHIIPIINYYTSNNDTTYVLHSTQDLYDWYISLTKGVNKEPCSKELKTMVDSLIAGCKTDLEKVKNIYYWTQKNIKYVAFEDGLGGFVPREANEVFQKKYGDCKDNSSLLKRMLNEAGINGHLTWIGTRDIPYKYDSVYSPIVDNHMILTYIENDVPYFLDATGRFLNMGLPSSFIQGKEALVAMDDEHYKIINVPIVESNTNYLTDSMDIKLDENKNITGIGKIAFNGYEKINIFNQLERIKTKEDLSDFYKIVLEKGNNNFLLDSIYEKNKYDYDNPFYIDYYFNIKNHVKDIDNKIYINLNLDKDDILSIKNTPPLKTIKEYTHQFSVSYFTKFTIPENYKIDFLPKNFETSNELCDVKINYTVVGNEIHYYHSVKTHFLTLTIAQQKQINELIEQVQRHFKEVVVLKSDQP